MPNGLNVEYKNKLVPYSTLAASLSYDPCFCSELYGGAVKPIPAYFFY